MWIKTQDGCLVNADKVSMIGLKSEEEDRGKEKFVVFLVVCVLEQKTTKEVFELGRYSDPYDAENELEEIESSIINEDRFYRMRSRSDYND